MTREPLPIRDHGLHELGRCVWCGAAGYRVVRAGDGGLIERGRGTGVALRPIVVGLTRARASACEDSYACIRRQLHARRGAA